MDMRFKEGKDAKYRGMHGGQAGGPARAAKLTPEERTAIAKKAAEVRWAKKKISKEKAA